MYNGTSTQSLGSNLASFNVSLIPYGSTVYTISTQEEMVVLPSIPPIVSIDDNSEEIARDFTLYQNFPNPFNPSTTIRFSILETANVSIKIYDVLGREISTLVNEVKTPGIYSSVWNGDDNSGNKVSSGIYFYRIQAVPAGGRSNNFIETKKMILLK